MAKRTAKAKGKHPATTLRGEDGRFLPNIPDPPGSPSQLGPGPSGPLPLTEPDISGTPMHPGGLGYHESSSSDKIYAANLRLEADLELAADRERTPPLRYSPPPGSPPGRSLSEGIPVTLPQYVPVTVESVTDEEVAARRRSHTELISPEIGDGIHVEQVTSSSNIAADSAPASVHSRDHPLSGALVLREFALESCSPGSADVENLLNKTCASTEPSRNTQDRSLNSIE